VRLKAGKAVAGPSVVSAVDSIPRLHQSFALSDGRRLGFAEYGDPRGKPVLFFPGTPSGRLFHHPDESIALSLGARIVTVDRPGYGLSDFQRNRTLLQWPEDVEQLADGLGLHRFAVAGVSGGAPYVAACALRIAPRLTTAAMISGLGPTDWPGAVEGMPGERRVGVRLGRRAPWLVRPLLWLRLNPRRNPERFYERMVGQSSQVDRSVLARADIRNMLITNWSEANRNGVRGYAWETVIFSRPWGFGLRDLPMEIRLWHGTEDASMPLGHAQYLAATFPRCSAKFLEGEGHFLLFDHWEEILASLVS
jgi:pimeloyl-ACP methyl ester carboxylesterase